jgi:subtilisin family serine protease
LSLEGAHAVRKLALLLALVAATTLLAAGVAFTQVPENGDPNRYIVVLEDDVDSPSQVANRIDQQQDLELGFIYSHALKGFSARIPDGRLAAVRADPRVAYVERDGKVHAVTQTIPWGIYRIGADLSSTEAGNGSGAITTVNVYIIDSGVDTSHADLNVVGHVNFLKDGENTDCSGHGTHVAGTVAAEDDAWDVVGVAPGAPVTGVKVLGCNDSGSLSTVIKGIDWVTDNAAEPAVANMSIAGPASRTLDRAVRRSAKSGVFYSIAAGNSGKPACNYSPARAGFAEEDTNGDGKINHKDSNGIVTTAAIESSGAETKRSNYGSCVDLWAPGKDVLSTQMGGGTVTMTGTSMAAPHVGGTGALYLSGQTGAAPATVESAIKAGSVRTDEQSKDDRRIRLVYAGGY